MFNALECQGRPEHVEDGIERSMMRAIRQVRRNRDLPDSVVMLIAEHDHCPEELLASAEQFCSPDVLEAFRGELGPLREDDLALYRSRIPQY